MEVQTSNQDLNLDVSSAGDETIEQDEVSEGFDAEMQKKIEEMIESVINSAREEVDWLRTPNESLETDTGEDVIETPITVEVSQPEEAPLPPPRRKPSSEDSAKIQPKLDNLPAIDESVQLSLEELNQQVVEESHAQTIIPATEVKPEEMSSILPSRLHLSSLEIDSLSVSSLQAGRIVASEIDSNTIVTNELECKSSHNLTNPMSLEFPPGFIEEIVERVRSADRAEHLAANENESVQRQAHKEDTKSPADDEDKPPARPPLPVQFDHPQFTSSVPPSFYQLRNPSEEESTLPQTPHRRRRHQNKRKDSTSEEDYQREHRSKSRGGASGGDQSILSLGGQFARACGNALCDSGGQLMEILRASSKDENKRDLHVAIIILIIIVAGLILMGMGEKPVHHHHWDFFNPPDNHGR